MQRCIWPAFTASGLATPKPDAATAMRRAASADSFSRLALILATLARHVVGKRPLCAGQGAAGRAGILRQGRGEGLRRGGGARRRTAVDRRAEARLRHGTGAAGRSATGTLRRGL